VEETPDPRGKFWVTPEQATKLIARVESAGDRSDPVLLESLRAVLSSGESQPEHEPR
jgi:hypothetical protein